MVVDLAAGTGKLGRLLAPSGARVVGVEPVDAMRELIPPDRIEALAGTAEAIPLPDGTADAVVAGQAFQWFDARRALTDIHRVLRPEGRLALVRNVRDLRDPVQGAFEDVLRRHRSHPSLEADLDVESKLRASGLFELHEIRSFPHQHELATGDIVALAASETSIALLNAEARAAAFADLGRIADSLAPRLRLLYITEVHLADRSCAEDERGTASP